MSGFLNARNAPMQKPRSCNLDSGRVNELSAQRPLSWLGALNVRYWPLADMSVCAAHVRF